MIFRYPNTKLWQTTHPPICSDRLKTILLTNIWRLRLIDLTILFPIRSRHLARSAQQIYDPANSPSPVTESDVGLWAVRTRTSWRSGLNIPVIGGGRVASRSHGHKRSGVLRSRKYSPTYCAVCTCTSRWGWVKLSPARLLVVTTPELAACSKWSWGVGQNLLLGVSGFTTEDEQLSFLNTGFRNQTEKKISSIYLSMIADVWGSNDSLKFMQGCAWLVIGNRFYSVLYI